VLHIARHQFVKLEGINDQSRQTDHSPLPAVRQISLVPVLKQPVIKPVLAQSRAGKQVNCRMIWNGRNAKNRQRAPRIKQLEHP
jgi:hypothetical protein